MSEGLSVFFDKIYSKYLGSQRFRILAILFLPFFSTIPGHAYVQANKYVIAGTTTHWGVDVSWYIQNNDGVENFKRAMDGNESERILTTLKRFNDAILFVIHPNAIINDRIDPAIATFATESQLTHLSDSLIKFPNCSFRQITVASDYGKDNVFFVAIYGYNDNGVWPIAEVRTCIERISDNYRVSGEK